ncbi:HpcH/HpaI aldolase/citrate lyase family protein [Mesotoga sp.]|uniref:HpcH/HpaI aldolase/citrate lyase family protein n=1 Tax=Mesotoga sp. TaxID=2053577 RepID=UPI00345EE19F
MGVFSCRQRHGICRNTRGGVFIALLKRNLIVNAAIDGLLREVILDKANGFVGKTIIHPSHLKYVNAMRRRLLVKNMKMQFRFLKRWVVLSRVRVVTK